MPINLAGSGQQLDGSLPTIFSEFKLLYDAKQMQKRTATKMTLKAHEGRSKLINNYGRLVAYEVADGADIAQHQDLSDETTTFTPGEVAAQALLAGSTMRRIQDPDILSRTGRMLANGYDLKEDSDGCAQLVNYSSALGSAGTVLSPGHMLAAQARAQGTGNNATTPEPFPGPWFSAIHPYQAIVIAGRTIPLSNVPTGTNVYGANTGAHAGVTATNGSQGSMNILRDGYKSIMHYAGADIITNANISVDSSGDASGAYYSKEGYIYVLEVEPTLDPDRSDKSMRGAVELNLWGSYVWGIYRPAASGVELLFDSTEPTS